MSEFIISQLEDELDELQANFEDMNDQDLLECRKIMLSRINKCIDLLEELGGYGESYQEKL